MTRMTDASISEITQPADADLVPLIDVSDTTDHADGTSVTCRVDNLRGSLSAQITASDPATGQFAVGGYEVGDTGWRDVTSSAVFVNGASPTILLRRTGNVVSIQVYGQIITAAPTGEVASQWTTSALNTVVPTGFRGTAANSVISASGSTGSLTRPIVLNWNRATAGGSGGGFAVWTRAGAVGSTSVYAEFVYQTPDTWPATLPGV